MNKIFLLLLLLAFIAYGQQQKRIAIINTVDDEEPPVKVSDLNHLTDRLREIATEILPQSYAVMTQQSMVAFLGSQEEMVKKCKASEGCLAKLGREINADYVGQGRIGRFGGNLSIKVELYETKSGNLVSSFTGSSEDVFGLLAIINEKTSAMFKKLPDVSDVKAVNPPASSLPPSFSEGVKGNVLTDSRDGKKYKVVKIGSQVWMAENLNYDASDSKCYGNKLANCEKYGRLYDWKTAMKTCPSGWHLPSKSEWESLDKSVGGGSGAGKKLKTKSGWNNSGNGTDEFGFSALPGGSYSAGGFFNVGSYSYWWSSSEDLSGNAYRRSMRYDLEYTYWIDYNKGYLFSVRCVQD
ncbi:MAG: fibrobacter succinogenes major paralogous domain-containing protein [Candidatus Fibromonas sp.]|jgi:uncharacterized protein (TIGR02145 family)|nr:fibrobacter succinogenes major paralogous domain-containing protein [Candidatus Fibromonas sp.]